MKGRSRGRSSATHRSTVAKRGSDLAGRELSVATKCRNENPRRPYSHGWVAFEVLRRAPDQRLRVEEYERRLFNPSPEVAALAQSVPGVPNAYQNLKHIRCDIARGHVDVDPPLPKAWHAVSRSG